MRFATDRGCGSGELLRANDSHTFIAADFKARQ